VIRIGRLRVAVVMLAAVLALAGCGAVTSEEHKVESSAASKVKSEADRLGTSLVSKAKRFPCHPSAAHIETAIKQLKTRDHNKLPPVSALEHAVCR
jgi:hypothetical protein